MVELIDLFTHVLKLRMCNYFTKNILSKYNAIPLVIHYITIVSINYKIHFHIEYKKKIKYAKIVATDLQNGKSPDQINEELLKQDLYPKEISEIIISARNIISDSFKPQINKALMNNEDILNAKEFASLDKETLQVLIDQESKTLGHSEKRKVVELAKKGLSQEDILAQIDTRFYSTDKAMDQIAKVNAIKKENSGSGRMINIGGGIALIVLTAGIFLATGRLFYVIPIIGLGLIIKGLIPSNDYND